jgi:hypothetical protein
MVLLTCDVPVSLRSALKMRTLATRQSESQLVIAALSQYLAQPQSFSGFHLGNSRCRHLFGRGLLRGRSFSMETLN